MKKWSIFVVGIGLYFILMSPTMELSTPLLITGILFILLGIYLYRRGGKNND